MNVFSKLARAIAPGSGSGGQSAVPAVMVDARRLTVSDLPFPEDLPIPETVQVKTSPSPSPESELDAACSRIKSAFEELDAALAEVGTLKEEGAGFQEAADRLHREGNSGAEAAEKLSNLKSRIELGASVMARACSRLSAASLEIRSAFSAAMIAVSHHLHAEEKLSERRLAGAFLREGMPKGTANKYARELTPLCERVRRTKHLLDSGREALREFRPTDDCISTARDLFVHIAMLTPSDSEAVGS